MSEHTHTQKLKHAGKYRIKMSASQRVAWPKSVCSMPEFFHMSGDLHSCLGIVCSCIKHSRCSSDPRLVGW